MAFQDNAPWAFNAAARIMWPDPPPPAHMRFLAAVFCSLYRGVLVPGTLGAAASKNVGLLRDAKNGKIILRWSQLEKQLRGGGWFLPPPEALDTSFQAAGLELTPDGWAIPEEEFNGLMRTWTGAMGR
jgi:hypothetical protein